MKKLFKIFIILFISIFLFYSFDIIFFYSFKNKYINVIKSQNSYMNISLDVPKYYNNLYDFSYFYKFIKNDFRPVMNKNSKESSIAIFGCSFAFGYVFDNNQTISYILSNYSNRPIYNRSYNTFGVQHMLYQFKEDKEIYNEIKNLKYIIYVLMPGAGHFQRMYLTNYSNIYDPIYYLSYVEKNGKLEKRKPLFNLYYDFSITRHLYNKMIAKKIKRNLDFKPDEKIINLFVLHFKESLDLVKKNYGDNVKFIVIDFGYNSSEYWESQLKELGIDVFKVLDVFDKKDYYLPKYGYFEPEVAPHPNAKFWEIVVPKLKEKYPDL